MIITLIGTGLIIFGLIGMYIWSNNTYSYEVEEIVDGISITCFIVGVIMTLLCIPLIIITHCTAKKDIYDAQLERECIVKQLEVIHSDYEDVSKSTVIQNAYDWNRKVYNAEYWSSNPWTNWFWDKEYVDSLEYIEMKD